VAQEVVGTHQKKAGKRRAILIFGDESGLSEKPPVRRTWAPIGETPILRHSHRWRKVSIMAALKYNYTGKPINLVFETVEGSYDRHALRRFARRLGKSLNGRPGILIWDNLRAHFCHEVVAELKKWKIEVERLPAYAPELNPCERAFSSLKGKDMANYAADGTRDLRARACKGVRRIRKDKKRLLAGFLRDTELNF
jgi:transposase